ncbi:S28 family serine protease [Microbispora sp. H10836]|uniref:S28 family serine protease n=1 Tax=Microbispora sp. H10836 TaxID=2729106 RepID=UPI0014736B3F|nr:S28 family serine protease [Microbispora sp. H10836]
MAGRPYARLKSPVRRTRGPLALFSAALASSLIVAVPAAAAPATGAGTVLAKSAASTAGIAEDDLLARLRAVPGLRVVSVKKGRAKGYKDYTLTFTQPVDHRNPRGGTFQQRLTLSHRSVDRPVVLYTSGYFMPEKVWLQEPAYALDANQLSVEHRFFGASLPKRKDWAKLDIWQEASDEHAIVEALKQVYGGAWIGTGASKGGMTAVYHHRFYPGDLDGVVAYVAPNDAVNADDRVYERFFTTVGTSSCRAALRTVQREALKRRKSLVPRLTAMARREGLTFRRTIGTADRSFELSVLDSAWTFWQYFRQQDCKDIPGEKASDAAIFRWVDKIQTWELYTDQGLEPYLPYYYQAATQLGWASLSFAHLKGLTRYPGLYQPNSVLPASLRSGFDGRAMRDVDAWVTRQASRMMFVYGGRDPWSAERFTPKGTDCHVFVAPHANHGASISRLSSRDFAEATDTLRRWARLT